jgi:ribosomal protein S18 acetylase RimI-like enzyme
MPIRTAVLRRGDEMQLSRVEPDVFDDPIDESRAREFLADPRHHLVVALDGDRIVGFIAAVDYVHPDKPAPELWINEVGVSAAHRRQGVGKALLAAVLGHARTRGCAQAWVLTDRSNAAAMRRYAALGGTASAAVMFEFDPGTPEPG